MLICRNIICALALSTTVHAFAPALSSNNKFNTVLFTSTGTDEQIAETTTKESKIVQNLAVPLSWDEMIRQAASAMKEAATEKGITRQIVRVLLPRDATNADFGKYYESSDKDFDSSSISLVPPDESWQGGIMQLYRAAAPTCQKILQKLTSDQGLPPRIIEDRTIDESGVDGIGLFTTDVNDSDSMKIQCFVQPTQEIADEFINAATNADNDQLVILMNPQWRQVDDVLDTVSKQDNGFLSTLANFLGGKGGVLKRVQEVGYTPVYTLEGYVCKGANVRLLQILDSDWYVFCEKDDKESFISVGTSKQRPTYQQVEEMLNNADIGYKYARDIGLQPKL